jgi:hypothetical protein
MPKFKTTILGSKTKDVAGIEVPPAVIENLGQGKKPKVAVTLKGYTYRSTVAVMGGKYLVGVAKEHREKAGVKAGDKLEVAIEADTAPREVEVPKDFAAALKKAGARAAFDKLAFSHRKEHVRSIEEAKAAETRARRIDKSVAMVKAKK